MPVRYIHQVLTRSHLAGLCRSAAVGLVTPLRDGMNLVAVNFHAKLTRHFHLKLTHPLA
jgi:trehalose 6-phosphate synthase